MSTAHSTALIKSQRALTLLRQYVLFLLCCLKINVVLVLALVLVLAGSAIAARRVNAAQREVETIAAAAKIEINEYENQLDRAAVKYARYKTIYPEKGIIHAKGLYPISNSLVRVNILEVSKKANPLIDIRPDTAFSGLSGRTKIRNIAKRNNSIAAVNGGYFKPQTGVPLGVLVIDNELLTGPVYNRAAIGINPDGSYSAGRTDFKFNIKNKQVELKIDNVNQPRMLSTYAIVYNERWGQNSPPPPKYGANIVIKDGKTIGLYKTSVQIPKNGYVVSGPEKSLVKLLNQKNLVFNTEYPEQFKNSEHIISGGPFLIKDGEIYIDAAEEKLTSVSGRNPRTLLGYTKENELIIATVDGREKGSIGMSLNEAAKFMLKLGCINAINLDGGSSSVMYLNGKITNKPPVDGGIPISGALTVNVNTAVTQADNNSHI